MGCRWNRSVVALLLAALVGCDSATPSKPADAVPAAATVSGNADPAASTANEFLDAVVRGDNPRAYGLLTPLAVERMTAAHMQFQLLGLNNYTFRVGKVARPADDKAFVQCMGTEHGGDAQSAEEEFCCLMCQIGDEWRVAGISFSAGPQKTLMIISFENPERGAMPVEQLMVKSPGQTADANGQSPGAAQPSTDAYPAQTTPRTAQGAVPAAAYR
jgi:hypothetical protein